MKVDEALASALKATADLNISEHQRALMMIVHMKSESGVLMFSPDDMHMAELTPVVTPPSLRDYIAIDAPIDYQVAERIYGAPMPSDDEGRSAFMAVWALLRYEFAEAMLKTRFDNYS